MAKAKFYSESERVNFVEKECGNSFFLTPKSEVNDWPQWAEDGGYTHRFSCSNNTERYLKVARTFALVAVDEDEYGNPVEEKWGIRVF